MPAAPRPCRARPVPVSRRSRRPRRRRRRPRRPRRLPRTAFPRTMVVTRMPTTTAVRTTATAASEPMRRRLVKVSVVVGVAAVAVAWGAGATSGGASSGHRPASAAVAWLHPAAPPAGWKVAAIPSGATLAYPPGWRSVKTDPGTASVALLGGGDRFDGFLNATPKSGTETAANWSRFRPDHNRGEGNRDVRLLASAHNLSFRSGRGSCVIDTYTTSKTTFREIACLVSGPHSTAVVVAAAPNAGWEHHAATLEQAISSFIP